jgi:hypothetical protein
MVPALGAVGVLLLFVAFFRSPARASLKEAV